MSMTENKYIGLALAVSSSVAIGSSFIITKKGLIDAADRGGLASHDHTYLQNPIWWAGMLTMVVGEIANFAAYTFAPPILITPLGALSVLIGAVLASFFLKEELGRIGRIGCTLCLVGSAIIVLHAPEDKEIETVEEILQYAMQPGFMIYCTVVLLFTLFMIYAVVPVYGSREPVVYLSICSLVGSISVMAIKGFGVAVKLTFAGNSQLFHPSTYVFAIVVAGCITVQMNYFNKALDQFSTNVVNPIYYVGFSSATIVASLIFFKGLGTYDAVNTLSLIMGFFVTFLGVYLLNISRADPDGQGREGHGRHHSTSLVRHSVLESGILPRMSLNSNRISFGSDRGVGPTTTTTSSPPTCRRGGGGGSQRHANGGLYRNLNTDDVLLLDNRRGHVHEESVRLTQLHEEDDEESDEEDKDSKEHLTSDLKYTSSDKQPLTYKPTSASNGHGLHR